MLQLGMFVYIRSVIWNRAGQAEDYSPRDVAPVYIVVQPGWVTLDTRAALEKATATASRHFTQ